jgi:hypothetical protein
MENLYKKVVVKTTFTILHKNSIKVFTQLYGRRFQQQAEYY